MADPVKGIWGNASFSVFIINYILTETDLSRKLVDWFSKFTL